MDSVSFVPPTYTIDLSLPPAERYVEIATENRLVLEDLPKLFDELMGQYKVPKRPVHLITRIALRKVHSKEQTEELRGISKVINVPMYLLVAYNVLLDSFMGCTSGGVTVRDPVTKKNRMMHFRTLDWGMPALRKALAQFNYVESKDGPIVARTIGYIGYVGVLTGVRPGLSISLNFRPYHNDDDKLKSNFKFAYHILRVVLGGRPSIASHLRHLLLPQTNKDKGSNATPICADLPSIAERLPSVETTACYLTFCDGNQTLILEKDRVTAKPILSRSFATTTNHDVSYDATNDASTKHAEHAKMHRTFDGIGMVDLVEESTTRKQCIVGHWQNRCKRFGEKAKADDNAGVWVGLPKLKEWINEYPVTNEETHFATIMDPKEGEVVWVKAYEEGDVARVDEEEDVESDVGLMEVRQGSGKLTNEEAVDLVKVKGS